MSRSLKWLPHATKKGRAIDATGYLAVADWISDSNHADPTIIERSMLDYLHGRADAVGPGPSAWRELIDALEHHESIELWVDY